MSAAVLTKLLLDLALEELHFDGLPVHKQHVTRLCHPDELHDALGICMSAEGHVLHLQLHVQLLQSQKDLNVHFQNDWNFKVWGLFDLLSSIMT